mgnify:FL=1|jgi:glycosyltransferase involved in cell wall biosynthesis
MKLSICIITKNEEENIERCLQSFQKYDFELVVVDTGSTDQTKNIAYKYTSHVYDYEWCDDFAAAKNYAVSKASEEYVMVIDSDEYLNDIDIKAVEKLIKENPYKVGRIKRINTFVRDGIAYENTEIINRIFSKKLFHYEGKIHEQVSHLKGKDYETYILPVTIGHSGYDMPEEERKQKARRNIKLLDLELKSLINEKIRNVCNSGQEDTQKYLEILSETLQREDEFAHSLQQDDRMPYILYQLGKGYYMAKEYEKACNYFSLSLSFDLNPKLEYVVDMVETYGYALINSGQADKAMFFENIYDEFGKTADFKFLMGLIYMKNGLFDKAIEEFKKATQMPDGRMKGVNSYFADYNIGVIYECLGDIQNAKKYYKMCGEYEPAKVRLSAY